jgi:hypothetical protein
MNSRSCLNPAATAAISFALNLMHTVLKKNRRSRERAFDRFSGCTFIRNSSLIERQHYYSWRFEKFNYFSALELTFNATAVKEIGVIFVCLGRGM